MKITIATGPIFPVPAVRGGAVQRLWGGLAHEFVKRGHEVTIFAREFPGQAAAETIDGIRYVRRGGYEQSTSIKRDLVQCLLYALKTARHVPTGDVVVTNDFWMPAVLPWIKPSAGRIVVNANRFPKNQFFLYKKCAAIAPVSESVADGIREQTPGISEKITVVPNCVDGAFLEQTKGPKDADAPGRQGPGDVRQAADGKRQTAESARPVRILFVGRIHPEKGLELLADALRLLAARKDEKTKSLKDHESIWECVLVGPVKQSDGGGGEEFVEEIKRKVAGLPVRFEPPVFNPADLAKIYDTGDILIYPSVADTGEAMPLAPLEGMARGLVPVVSDIAAFREYLEPGVNGAVFDHRSKDAAKNLAAVLQELIANAEDRKRMGEVAQKTAERFSPAAIADKYLQLFEKVISGR